MIYSHYLRCQIKKATSPFSALPYHLLGDVISFTKGVFVAMKPVVSGFQQNT